MTRKLWGALFAVAFVVGSVYLPARAADFFVVAGPEAQFANYLTPIVVYQLGGSLTFYDVDIANHDVRAQGAYYPVQCPRRPGTCPKGTPVWCLPAHPRQPYTTEFGSSNRLPFAAGKCPLFWTPLIQIAKNARVQGLERAQAGKQYTFVCSIHPGMKGTLIVVS